jgi:hypothetical protein
MGFWKLLPNDPIASRLHFGYRGVSVGAIRMADLDPCQLLRDADKAWFEMNTGGAVRVIRDQNGEQVEYSSANRAGLLNMIYALQELCPTYKSIAISVGPKPMKYLF